MNSTLSSYLAQAVIAERLRDADRRRLVRRVSQDDADSGQAEPAGRLFASGLRLRRVFASQYR